MHTFLPAHPIFLFIVFLSIGLLVLVGFGTIHLKQKSLSRILAWLVASIMTGGIHFATLDEPAGFRMLAIIAVLFVSMKIVVANEYRWSQNRSLTWLQWILFALGWFGMNPGVFIRKDKNKRAQGIQLIRFGISRMIIGIGLCVLAWLLFRTIDYFDWPFGVAVISLLLVGLSLFLHFGILNVNSGLLNLAGYGAYALFRQPLRSLSLGEFWGRRWNLAFSEMASIAVFRPLKQVASERTARIAAFAFSGILHEFAISLPVHHGYGLPSLYFVLQAIGISLEKRVQFRSNTLRHIWVLSWLILPMPVLFHKWFLREIIISIMGF